MKKIVGILAAAALIATSVFAADVSAKVRIDGDIFAYDGTAIDAKDGKVAGSFSLLRSSSQARPYWSPYITLSTSTDDAGASIMFIEEGKGADDKDGDGGRNIRMDRSSVWFKPLDMLKVTVGWQDFTTNKESIDYDPNPTGTDGYGYGIGFEQDAISANVFLKTGNNGWFYQDAVAAYGSSKDPISNYINLLYVNASYAADFGTISALFSYEGKKWDYTKPNTTPVWHERQTAGADTPNNPDDDTWVWEKTTTLPEVKSFTPDTIKFGAGYKNTIDNLTFFADVIGTSISAPGEKEKAYGGATDKDGNGRSVFGLMADGFVQYNMDALTLKGYLRLDVTDFGHLTVKDGKKTEDIMADNNFSLGIKLRADYKLENGINLFAQFNDKNLLQKQITDKTKSEWKDASSVFVSEIKLGANGSVGVCDWETKLKIETGANVTKSADADQNNKYNGIKVSMPVYFQVAF
jgi:hypothetical protein